MIILFYLKEYCFHYAERRRFMCKSGFYKGYYKVICNIVLIRWKKSCFEDYHKQLENTLSVIKKHCVCDCVVDTRQVFLNQPDDMMWVADVFISTILEYGYKTIYFMIDKDNSFRHEFETLESRFSGKIEFSYVYSYIELIKMRHSKYILNGYYKITQFNYFTINKNKYNRKPCLFLPNVITNKENLKKEFTQKLKSARTDMPKVCWCMTHNSFKKIMEAAGLKVVGISWGCGNISKLIECWESSACDSCPKNKECFVMEYIKSAKKDCKVCFGFYIIVNKSE